MRKTPLVATGSLVVGMWLGLAPTANAQEEADPCLVIFETGAATITGTDGNDLIRGTDGPDVILAGPGDDVIWGLGGDDLICGGTG